MDTQIVICKDHRSASHYAAGLIADYFAKKPELTVTFAAGDTPFLCYRELIRRQKEGELRLDLARYIGLDEWVGLGPDTEGSCIASMSQGYYHPAGIPGERILAFDGLATDLDVEIERMRKNLRQYPLDLAVLGVGVNGHVGFNEPGVPTTGDFSLVTLSESTQMVGRKYFSGKQTPTHGATITLQALKRAERVIVLATGISKRDAVSGILGVFPLSESCRFRADFLPDKAAIRRNTGGISRIANAVWRKIRRKMGDERLWELALPRRDDLPASVFLEHPGVCFVFDEEAAGVAGVVD